MGAYLCVWWDRYEENNYMRDYYYTEKRASKNREGTFPSQGHDKWEGEACIKQASLCYRSSRIPDAQLHIREPTDGWWGNTGALGQKGANYESTVHLYDWGLALRTMEGQPHPCGNPHSRLLPAPSCTLCDRLPYTTWTHTEVADYGGYHCGCHSQRDLGLNLNSAPSYTGPGISML